MMKQKRVFHQDVFARNNQYNPITQIYKDPVAEINQNKSDEIFMAQDRKTNFDRSLSNHTSQYNIVNFLSKRDQTVNMAKIEPGKEMDKPPG